MTDDNLSHARKNLLTGEWILVSPQRNQRPWQGQVDTRDMEDLPEFDPDCYLCPGNTRANGEVNRDYRGTFVFDNDFPALTDEAAVSSESNPLLENRPEPGICRVVCYTERHDRRLTTMPMDGVSECLKTLADEFSALDSRDDISYVQMFENRGSMMGCSNPHPHAQIWATRNLPTEIEKELREQQRWYESKAGQPRS